MWDESLLSGGKTLPQELTPPGHTGEGQIAGGMTL